jgi:hypothetical protein
MIQSRFLYAVAGGALVALGVVACSGSDATVGGGGDAGDDATAAADAQTMDGAADVTSGSDSSDGRAPADAGADGVADAPSDAPSDVFVGIDGGALGPTVQILHPGAGVDRKVNVSIYFHGTATDPTDGTLSGNALVWLDSLEGQFGTGDPVNWAPTRVGSHTITLRATDSRNYTATASITFNVIP